MLEPVVQQLSQEWAGKVTFYKVDVDENPNLAMQYQVMGVPTLMLFVKGQPVERISGYNPKAKIVARFGQHLQNGG
jgi:thioredoxin 1